MENQNNLVREVQESISSLNSIIKNTREEVMATTNSNQLLMTENMRNLTKALEIVKDNMMSRVASLDSAMVDLNGKMDLTTEAFNENTIKTTQAMENEFNRVDRIMNRFEDLLTESNKNLNDRIVENERKQQAWRSEYEDKNHNIFKEMSTALKSLKKQILKVNKDSGDRDTELQKLIEDSKRLAEGMFKNLDQKANHLEEVYGFKLDETTKVWEHNLQIEVDKVLDAITINSEAVQTDFVKRMANLKIEVNKAMFENVDKEVHNMRELVADTRRILEDSTISKLKDAEVRLENLFRTRFDEYRYKLEDSIREFNRLKGEMEHIKKDYYNALETVREDMKANARREVETLKAQLVNRIKENKEQLDELLENKVKVMKEDIQLNKEDMQRGIDAAKLDIQSELQTATNDIKNLVDKNDQIIHTDVNNKMNSLNEEIGTQKKFLMERMDEMHESTKSLARALVNEEAANRANKDEMIIKLFDRKINNLNSYIMSQVEQRLDETRIGLENKIKDALNDLEDFKRWTIDEFSNVRTEHEIFKQEYYARDYADHLFFLTFESMVRTGFDGTQQQFHEVRLAMENMGNEMKEADAKLKEDIEKEQDDRKEADEKIEEEFSDYKKLNEKTWEEMIAMYHADNFTARLNLSLVEEAVYESIRRIITSLSTLGGASDDLLAKLEATNKELDKHKEKVTKQDKENSIQFKSITTTATDFRKDYDGFVKVAKKNFEVTEESLSILSHLINSLDSQLNIEQIMSMATVNLLEQRSAAAMAEVESTARLMNNHTKEEFEQANKKLEKRIVEDYIPSQILKVNESLNTFNQQSKDQNSKLTETLQKKITEHQITIEKHGDQLKSHEKQLKEHSTDIEDHSGQLKNHSQRIKFAEENLKDAGDDMKKVGQAITDTNAHLVFEGATLQAEIGMLKAAMGTTIKEIFESLSNFSASGDSDAEATAASVGKVNSRLKELDKKLADLYKAKDKNDKKISELEKAQGKQEGRITKIEEAKDKESTKKPGKKGGDAEGGADTKQVKELRKDVDKILEDIEELKAAAAEAGSKKSKASKGKKGGKGKKKKESDDEDGEEEDDDDDDESKKSDKKKSKGKDGDLGKLQAQVAKLQSQMKELEEKVEELEEKGKGEDDDDEGSDKKSKESKKKKPKKQKSDDSGEEEEGSTKIGQEDLDSLEEKIDKKLEELKEELLEKIGDKDKSGSEESEEKSDKKKNKKGKKGKDVDDDDDKSDNDKEDNEERFKSIEERLEELEGKIDKDKSGDDDKESKKEKSDDEDTNEKFEKLNEKIDEMEERLNKLEEEGGSKKGDKSDEKSEKSDGDKDDKIDEKIDEKLDEKLEEMKKTLKEELLEELKEEKSDKDDDDEKSGKKSDNNKIWDEINDMKEKIEELEKLEEKVGDLEKQVEELKEGEGSKD